MAKDQETKKREAEERRRLIDAAKAEIRAYIGRVPPSHSKWSYQRAVAFKSAVSKADQIIRSERATVVAAQMAASELAGYFK